MNTPNEQRSTVDVEVWGADLLKSTICSILGRLIQGQNFGHVGLRFHINESDWRAVSDIFEKSPSLKGLLKEHTLKNGSVQRIFDYQFGLSKEVQSNLNRLSIFSSKTKGKGPLHYLGDRDHFCLDDWSSSPTQGFNNDFADVLMNERRNFPIFHFIKRTRPLSIKYISHLPQVSQDFMNGPIMHLVTAYTQIEAHFIKHETTGSSENLLALFEQQNEHYQNPDTLQALQSLNALAFPEGYGPEVNLFYLKQQLRLLRNHAHNDDPPPSAAAMEEIAQIESVINARERHNEIMALIISNYSNLLRLNQMSKSHTRKLSDSLLKLLKKEKVKTQNLYDFLNEMSDEQIKARKNADTFAMLRQQYLESAQLYASSTAHISQTLTIYPEIHQTTDYANQPSTVQLPAGVQENCCDSLNMVNMLKMISDIDKENLPFKGLTRNCATTTAKIIRAGLSAEHQRNFKPRAFSLLSYMAPRTVFHAAANVFSSLFQPNKPSASDLVERMHSSWLHRALLKLKSIFSFMCKHQPKPKKSKDKTERP